MNNAILYFLSFVLLAALGCTARAQNEKPLSEEARYRLAAAYSADSNGVSMLVVKGDKIVFEEYSGGRTAETAWFLASGTKSFSGVMLAAAVEDKLVAGFDEKVSETITEWKRDPEKAPITLRQLLTLTSGIDAGRIGRVPAYAEAVNFNVKHKAGTRFEYGPVPFQIFGEVMRRKLAPRGETVTAYLKRRVLDPIGLKVAGWRTGADQNPLLPQGASLTAREWAKFGQFLKGGGRWNGKQVIAKKHLDELMIGSAVNPAYGLTFWLNQAGVDPRGRANRIRVEAPRGGPQIKDLWVAAGAGNQRLYIIRSLDLVVVRQGDFGSFDDGEFLGRLVFGKTN